MSEEIFDIVDDNDHVIGSLPRARVHREGHYHRAIHVFVFNREGRLFLQQRSLQKDTAPGKWVSSCSGHVDSGETYEAAAIRELAEEIGLVLGEPLEPQFKVKPCPETGLEYVWLYRCEAEGPFVLDPAEIQRGEWFSREELSAWIAERPRDFAWSFLYLWERYLDSVLKPGKA